MIEYKAYASEIASRINGILIGDDILIEQISIDTRENVKKPFCFFAIEGKNFDGHNFINEAIKNGAALIVAEKKIDTNLPIIYVDSTIKALGLLAKNTIRKAKIIGVTGSVGKTTTKNVIASVLSEKFKVISTNKNFNNEIGVALTLLSVKDEDYCVVEMGARKTGDIKWLSFITEPEICVITNCESAHIEYFGTKEAIFNEKISIINNKTELVLLPNEIRFKERKYGNLTPIFLGERGDYSLKKVKIKKNYIVGKIFDKKRNVSKFKCNIMTKEAVKSLLYAYVIGKDSGMTNKQIKNGIKKYSGEEQRAEILEVKKCTLINDTYNASYESVIASINLLCDYSKINKKTPIVVLGDMLELGKDSEKYHYLVGKCCKERGIKLVYTYGKYGNNIIKGCLCGKCYDTKEKLIRELLEMNLSKCAILFKASRIMGFEKIVEVIKEKLNG